MITPRIALVPGEPAGIGPEIAVRVAQRGIDAAVLAFADPDVLAAAAAELGIAFRPVDSEVPVVCAPGTLAVSPVPLGAAAVAGRPDPRNAEHVLGCLARAADGCLAGGFDAMVTGPVQKSSIADAGHDFSGTTEFLARRAGGADVVMMLANHELRVALVTTHLPLRAVADAITPARLEATMRVLHAALRRDLGIDAPRIAVLGLNPHAGESGHLGREEIEVIEPVLRRLRDEGMTLAGPLPADTAFLPARLAQTDAVLAMYHDQGLPVLKHSGFERAVNISLGLPFVRVAVDHGTALELAGTGRADASSLMAAVDTAIAMAHARAAAR